MAASKAPTHDRVIRQERQRNPFMLSKTGGRVLSAMMLPLFTLRPPSGFGVLTTTGRRTGKARPKCIHAVHDGDRAYVVMLRPPAMDEGSASAWVLNIRANPSVRLRSRHGTFAGIARELHESVEIQAARDAYCATVNPFDYVECVFHCPGRPTRTKIQALHHHWFDTGIPLVIELGVDGR